MDDLPRRELLNMIARKGIGVCLDPRHFEGELSSLCGGCEKEVFVLATALRKDVISELLRASDTSPVGEKLPRLAGRLHDLGLDRQVAMWAVETWAIALGLLEVVDQPSLADEPRAPEQLEYDSPHCHEAEEADGPGRIVPAQERRTEGSPQRMILKERMDRLEEVAADESMSFKDRIWILDRTHSEIRKEDLIRGDEIYSLYFLYSRLRDKLCELRNQCEAEESRLARENTVEVECPNPDGCGTSHIKKSELPTQVECSCGWTFEVDAEGRTTTPEGLITVRCPFCEQSSQHHSAGEVECYQPGCGKTLFIDGKGRVLNKLIEAQCPMPSCETIQNAEAAGEVVCDGCGHKYTIDEDGDVVDPGEGVWEVECENPECKGKFYKDADSKDEHFDGGYECPYCGHSHGHEDDEEADEGEDEEADEDGDDELEDENEDELAPG